MASKYEKVFASIEQKILNGLWETGMLMPTESELCSLYEVSRITVRRALSELEKLGLVDRIQGKGSFVGRRRFHSTNSQGFRDSMAEQGITVHSKILIRELVHPDPDTAGKLGLGLPDSGSGSSAVWHFCRLRYVGIAPVALMHSYIPREIGDGFAGHDLESASFYRLISEITGKAIVDTKGAVTAVIPSEEECRLLEVPSGSAHIRYRSVGYLEDGRAVEVSSSIFNAEMYEFSVRYEHLQSCITE